MSEFKVGDRVRIKSENLIGKIREISVSGVWFDIETRTNKTTKFYDISVGNKNYIVRDYDLELIERAITNEQIKLDQLEQRIEKLEKYAIMGKYATDRKENVSNFEKMEQNTIEKRENEPLYEINERFAKILKKELEEKPNLEINLGKPNIDDKEFKQMLKNKPIVLNTNDPLEMIWNSTEEETKPSLLTEDERVILMSIPKKYNWIVRDKDWDLYVFEERPYQDEKDYYYWKSSNVVDGDYFGLFFNSMFMGIKKDTLYNIEELLKGECEE